MIPQRECVGCKKTEDQSRLEKCSICFRWYCQECAYHMSGRTFCSHFCAEHFFFEPEE